MMLILFKVFVIIIFSFVQVGNATISKRQQKLEAYGFNLIGALFSRGVIVPWDGRFSDTGSETYKEIETTICKYLTILSSLIGLETKSCKIKKFEEASTSIGSYTNVYVELVTGLSNPDASSSADRDKAKENLMDVVGWFSNIGKANYYIGVRTNKGFQKEDVFVYSTQNGTMSVAWTLKPSDCREIYKVEWKVKGTSEIFVTDETCQNSYGPIKIDPSKEYEVRVSSREQGSSRFDYSSDWYPKSNSVVLAMSITGEVKTVGDTPFPYSEELSELKKTSGATLASDVCNSLQMQAIDSGVLPVACRTISISSDSKQRTLANCELNVIGDSLQNTGEQIKAGIAKTASESPNDPNRMNIFMSKDINIDKFYGSMIEVGTTGADYQKLSWSEYPTDCSYEYEVEYRKRDGIIQKLPTKCENNAAVRGLSELTEYQYRVITRKSSGSSEVALPWTDFIKTGSKSNCSEGCIIGAAVGSVVGFAGLAFLGVYLYNRNLKKKTNLATKMMLSDITPHFHSSAIRDSMNENIKGNPRYNDIRYQPNPLKPSYSDKIKEFIQNF